MHNWVCFRPDEEARTGRNVWVMLNYCSLIDAAILGHYIKAYFTQIEGLIHVW